MPPVLTEVNRYLVGSAEFGQQSCLHRTRFCRFPRLTDGGDVIEIDSKTDRKYSAHFPAPVTRCGKGIRRA